MNARTARRSARNAWGPWRFDARRRALDHANGYYADLDRCTTSAELADWIFQIAGKLWADDATLAGLVRALDALLEPQATLCSFGLEKGPIDIKKILAWTAEERRREIVAQRAVDAYIAAERERLGDPDAIVAVPLALYLGGDEAAVR